MNREKRIVRPELRDADIRRRGEGMARARLRAIRRGLRTLHTLELMACTIYRFQITKRRNEHNRELISAMCNEMTHYQDFQVKLGEYGFRPNAFRAAFLVAGFVFGFVSRLLGGKAVLRTGILVETKAVHHYETLLDSIEWDDDTRRIIEKDRADEEGHIARWQALLAGGSPSDREG